MVAMLLLTSPLSAQKLKTITEKYASNTTIKTEYTVLKKKKNIKHGTYKTYFESGAVKLSGTYDQNRKAGEWKEYDVYGGIRRVRTYRLGKLLSDKKHGVWKETTSEGKLRFFDYDKNERVLPQFPLHVSYPSEARESNISGVVKIKAALDKDCQQKELTVVKSLGKEFDAEAISAVKIYLEKMQFYEYDCPGFNKVFTFDFKNEVLYRF